MVVNILRCIIPPISSPFITQDIQISFSAIKNPQNSSQKPNPYNYHPFTTNQRTNQPNTANMIAFSAYKAIKDHKDKKHAKEAAALQHDQAPSPPPQQYQGDQQQNPNYVPTAPQQQQGTTGQYTEWQ